MYIWSWCFSKFSVLFIVEMVKDVKSDPFSMMGIWSSASDSPVVALELEQWDRREEFAGLVAK